MKMTLHDITSIEFKDRYNKDIKQHIRDLIITTDKGEELQISLFLVDNNIKVKSGYQ